MRNRGLARQLERVDPSSAIPTDGKIYKPLFVEEEPVLAEDDERAAAESGGLDLAS